MDLTHDKYFSISGTVKTVHKNMEMFYFAFQLAHMLPMLCQVLTAE